MKESQIYNRAINPEQYDLDDLGWETESGKESTRNFFFWEYLQKYSATWNAKDILEIGAGNGWILEEAKRAGAKSVLGIEPSVKNNELAKKARPEIKMVKTTLENFENHGKQFDTILSVMSISHMNNVGEAFIKINSLMNLNGEFLIITPDFEYFRIPRHDYNIKMEDINSKEYAIAISRPSGTIADIVRKDEVYIRAAQNMGWKLAEQVPMLPTEAYIAKAPKFGKYKDRAICQLFRFIKS